jgi:hypothetical protein
VRVCTLNFGVVRKNVVVHVHVINLAFHGLHTNNNDVRGVHSVGKAQRSFVGARAMWVYFVTRQFS